MIRSATNGIRAPLCWLVACSLNYGPQSSADAAVVGSIIAAQHQQCDGIPVDVTANTVSERSTICRAAAAALRLAAPCGLGLSRSLEIRVRPEVHHPFGQLIFGRFDAEYNRVLVAEFATAIKIARGSPFGRLPPTHLYDSIVVHEVIHGLVHQNLPGKLSSQAAYEYPAYAFQIASLPADVRRDFLGMFNPHALKGHHLFNSIILGFDPAYFAARSYLHMTSFPNKCALLRTLIANKADFFYVGNDL